MCHLLSSGTDGWEAVVIHYALTRSHSQVWDREKTQALGGATPVVMAPLVLSRATLCFVSWRLMRWIVVFGFFNKVQQHTRVTALAVSNISKSGIASLKPLDAAFKKWFNCIKSILCVCVWKLRDSSKCCNEIKYLESWGCPWHNSGK